MATKPRNIHSTEAQADDQQTVYCEITELAKVNGKLRRWIAADRGLEAYCFTRDVTQSIIPYTLDGEVVVTLDPPDHDTEHLIAVALGQEHYSEEFDRAVVEFIRRVANTIMHFGAADYELVFEHAAGESRQSTNAFYLRYVTPHSIRRRFFCCVQDIGPVRAAELKIGRFRFIDRTKIVRFVPPFGLSRLFRVKRRLSYFEAHPIPQFNLGFTEQLRSYDFTAAVAMKDLAVATITRDIGWHATASFDKHALDAYSFTRELRFHRFVMSIRDAIVTQLNVTLNRALPRLGTRGEIRISGLNSRHDLDQLELQFRAGADLRALVRQLY